MKILQIEILIFFILAISSASAEVIPANTVQDKISINIPAPIKVIEDQCLITQVCEPDQKLNNTLDNPTTLFFGIITYRLQNDIAYITNNGKISRVKEITMQNETQKSVDNKEDAVNWCMAKKKQLSEFYTLCKKSIARTTPHMQQ
ncbi:MAG: hypothetical protein ACXWE9_03735 [Methylobacter sp.]